MNQGPYRTTLPLERQPWRCFLCREEHPQDKYDWKFDSGNWCYYSDRIHAMREKMLDDDDLGEILLFWPVSGWVTLALGIAVAIIVAIAVSNNREDCFKMSCATGKPVLMDHSCYCVEKAQP